MKNLMFSLVFMLINTLAFANTVKFENHQNTKNSAESELEINVTVKNDYNLSKITFTNPVTETPSACSNWIAVTASCGVVYYLCADNYNSAEAVAAAVLYFDKTKCLTPP